MRGNEETIRHKERWKGGGKFVWERERGRERRKNSDRRQSSQLTYQCSSSVYKRGWHFGGLQHVHNSAYTHTHTNTHTHTHTHTHMHACIQRHPLLQMNKKIHKHTDTLTW